MSRKSSRRTGDAPAGALGPAPWRPLFTPRRSGAVTVWLVLILAILARWQFLADWPANFDADEALVALQAQEIAAGQRPLFLPGQAYMGALQSAFAALGMAILGPNPTAARVAVLLWIIPGFLALRRLQRALPDTPGAIPGSLLLSQWLLPPAVLFLAGVKIRGGNLESLVLLLWATALMFEAAAAHRRGRYRRILMAGVLMGLAGWTHEQALLGAPLIAALLIVATRRRAWLAWPGFLLAAGIGYAPLWWPRIAVHRMGPPGLQDAGAGIQWAGIGERVAQLPGMIHQSVVAGAEPGAVAQWGGALLTLLSAAACGWMAYRLIREALVHHTVRPLPLTVLLLAAGNGAALLLQPSYFDDHQWFRYTLYMAPAILVARAAALACLPRGWQPALHGLVLGLTLLTYVHAKPAWDVLHPERDGDLVEHLIERDIHVVQAEWDLAYRLRFLSRGRILASSGTPARYPLLEMQTTYRPECYRIRRLEGEGSRAIEDLYEIKLRQRRPPPQEFVDSILGLDRRTTLVPHYEPFPLLMPGAWHQDWRGWPPQRPLARFDAIVWWPGRATHAAVDWDAISRRIEELIEEGTFVQVAQWREERVLRRVGRPPEEP